MDRDLNPLDFMRSLQSVLLTHYQSSGITYLHSLFDSHPEIISIPGCPNLDHLMDEEYYTLQEALDLFNKANPKFFDTSKFSLLDMESAGLYRLGENADEGFQLSKEKFEGYFKECLKDQLQVSVSDAILSLYYAYSRTRGEKLVDKKVVLLHPHDHFRAIKMSSFLPNVKCFITHREISAAYYSRLNLTKNKNILRNIFGSHVGLLSDPAKHVLPLVKRGIEFRIVRIEDFEKHSKYCLTQLCEFVGISYQSSLECSTFFGKKWNGANPKFRHTKFTNERLALPKITKRENNIFYLISKKFNTITGYKNLSITFLDKLLFPIWLFLPLPEDFQLVKQLFFSKSNTKLLIQHNGESLSKYKVIIKLFKERLKLFFFLINDMKLDREYESIKRSFIKCPDV